MAAVGSRFTRTGVENYTLPLNVRVRNSTAKEIEVIYLRTTSHTSGDHCYEIRFGGTPLLSAGFIRETNIAQSSVSPKGSASKRTHTPPPFTFIGSTSFSFSSVKGNEQLIKLVETDKSSRTILYVNPEEPISPSWSDNSFYPVYSYQPETVLKEAAYASISHITATRSMRKEDILAYNQHGTALFFRGKDQYTLYWAQPDESMANPIALLPKVSFLRSSKAAAFSQDGRVGLILDETGICYLNGEVATRLVTNTADTQDF